MADRHSFAKSLLGKEQDSCPGALGWGGTHLSASLEKEQVGGEGHSTQDWLCRLGLQEGAGDFQVENELCESRLWKQR